MGAYVRAWPSVAVGPVCAGLYKPMYCVLLVEPSWKNSEKRPAFVAGGVRRPAGVRRPVNHRVSCFCLIVRLSSVPTKPVAHKVDAEEKKQGYSGGSTVQRHAGFQMAFDGLNCFETVMMH